MQTWDIPVVLLLCHCLAQELVFKFEECCFCLPIWAKSQTMIC